MLRTETSRAGPRNKKGAPWTATSGGLRSHKETQTRTGSSGEEQDGKQAGPLDCSNRGAEDRSTRQDCPGIKMSSSRLNRPGLNTKEERKPETNSGHKEKTR